MRGRSYRPSLSWFYVRRGPESRPHRPKSASLSLCEAIQLSPPELGHAYSGLSNPPLDLCMSEPRPQLSRTAEVAVKCRGFPMGVGLGSSDSLPTDGRS